VVNDGQMMPWVYRMRYTIPDLSIEIFSAEFVLGPVTRSSISDNCGSRSLMCGVHTNCANNGGSTVILLWLKVGVQARSPFQLRLVGKMLESIRHDEEM
jgi:hypothetical protein